MILFYFNNITVKLLLNMNIVYITINKEVLYCLKMFLTHVDDLHQLPGQQLVHKISIPREAIQYPS